MLWKVMVELDGKFTGLGFLTAESPKEAATKLSLVNVGSGESIDYRIRGSLMKVRLEKEEELDSSVQLQDAIGGFEDGFCIRVSRSA